MEEEKKTEEIQEEENQEVTNTITMKRHLYPEEIALKKEKKKVKKLKIWAVSLSIVFLLVGWFGGSIFPMSAGSLIRNLFGAGTLDSSNKIQSVLDVMENDWYFGSDIEDLDTRLTDQALTGITSNSEDTHTEYMSAEEVESFTQSINRNYVGIGIEYLTSNGLHIVERVFKDSPAEKAGVQAGDIIESVDGTSIENLTSEEIKNLVQGDEGTKVTITFKRNGIDVSLNITRATVSSTVYGEMKDDIAYLQLYQFGQTTPKEVKAYLDDFKNANATKLIIDLRDNGGGYLDSVASIAACFLPKDSVVLQQEFSNGTISVTKTSEDQYSDLGPIVILVNENTASAAEVLTLALKEQRSDVQIVGTTTYGKGTVQITKYFSDGSALKYTTSKWLSSKNTWVNGVGITPDEEVKLDDVFYQTFSSMKEGESYAQDSVADAVKDAQLCLHYLGYDVDRTDGYFSLATESAILAFQNDNSLGGEGVLNQKTYEALLSSVVLDWSTTDTNDTQLKKAEEILNG